jgi:hypothetical protein
MEDKNYNGVYAIKITLTDTAFTNPQFNEEIRKGKIEKILLESEGVKNFWKGASGCQNVVVVTDAKNSFDLIKKLNELPYVREITLLKDGLIAKEGYIPVTD